MASCEQTSGQTILEHGESVNRHFQDLIGGQTLGWKLPIWFTENREWFLKQLSKFDSQTIEDYLIYHDVGKPYCRTVDADGKVHFPFHSQISAGVWNASNMDPIAGKLIARDMDLHLLKPSHVKEYVENHDKILIPILMLSALSEIHSNAGMFGGIESTSFKIKWKNLDRVGSNLIKELL